MRADARAIAERLALGAALASIGYAFFATARVRRFGRALREQPRPTRLPPITVLKPVRGLEPQFEENLRSFCAQDYPDYRVVLGVRSADDAALPLLRTVAAEFPARANVVVGDDERPAADGGARYRNPKIATLAPMLPPGGDGEIVVIADSDMRVAPDYLLAVAEAFGDSRTGAATAIYRGEPADGRLASALGAMWITEQFAPSALVSAALEPLAHTFGATMAVRRSVLGEIGGLDALGERLADDHALGRLVAGRGYRVALIRRVVTNVVAEPSLSALARHELRWARTIRTVRPGGYAGIVLTYPVPLALLHAALARDRTRGAALLALALFARIALGRVARRTLARCAEPTRANDVGALHGSRKGALVRPLPWLIPLRDALGIAVWALGLRGGEVRWRDASLRVGATGILGTR